MKQPGLDDRQRNEDGRIHAKRSDTLVRTIRESDPNFAPGIRADAKLGTVLKNAGVDSLSKYNKKKP